MTCLKKGMAVIVALIMLCGMVPASASALDGFEEYNCLKIATEPEEISEYVSYYKHNSKNSMNALTWEEGGVHGKALVLNGKNEYLRISKNQLRMSQMTFTTWINFQGSANPEKPKGAYWQRLFTIQADKNCYFTVSPHAFDSSVTKADGQLDSIYMEYYRGNADESYSMKSFIGATPNRNTFGLPQNEWHHLTVVVDTQSVKLYVDGKVILEEVFVMPIVQMNAEAMLIGGGLWGDPLLNAWLDDTMLFDRALTDREIAALMQTGNVGTLQNPAAATTKASNYEPTQGTGNTTSTTKPTEQPEDKPMAPFGLPLWGFIICVVLAVLVVAAIVAVNLYEIEFRKKYGNATTQEAPVFNLNLEKKREWLGKRLLGISDKKSAKKDDEEENEEVFE